MAGTNAAKHGQGREENGEQKRKKRKTKLKPLDLVIANPSRRKWSVFQIKGKANSPPIRSAEELKERLEVAMAGLFDWNVLVKGHRESLWVQLSGETFSKVGHKEQIFMVHPPHSPYLFVTSFLSKDVLPIFNQGLCVAFGVLQLEEIPMIGRDVNALKDLALQKLSQGAFSAYRLCASAFDHSPLEDKAAANSRRRKVINQVLARERAEERDHELLGEERNKVIVKSKKREPLQRFSIPSEAMERTTTGGTTAMGSRSDETPKFKSICVRTEDDQFKCFVKFQGKDVLQGLDSLYANDLVCDNKEIPKVFDASEVMRQNLDGGGTSEARFDKETGTEAKTSLLWSRTG